MKEIKTKKIAVLLAVYNGMLWIEPQVESILKQQRTDVHLFISVDPSTDSSEEWCYQLSQSNKQVTLLKTQEKFGSAAPNFFRLIKEVDFTPFDYIAFSDHDDIWNKDKLIRASSKLTSKNHDAYSSNVIAFWPDGKQKLIEKAQPQVKWDYLFESAGPGCTFVLTQKLAFHLQQFIIKHAKQVQSVWLHDWFTYAFARSNGYNWYIDKKPSLLYRQHLGNQVGVNAGLNALWYRVKFITSGRAMYQSSLLASLFGLENNAFVKKWHHHSRLGFLWLSLHANQCRRKPSARLLFICSCFILFWIGQ